MALNTKAITAGVAGLTITGVDIRDINNIPVEVVQRNCPIMFPQPGEIAGGYEDEPGTFGGATGAYWSVSRQISYLYLHVPIGDGRSAFVHYPDLADKADVIIEKFMELDITGIDVLSVKIDGFSKPIEDPSGNQFFGFVVNMTVREKVNA
jgi:hypothetical protein